MAETAIKPIAAKAPANDAGDNLDAKGTIETSHTSELVIALCGPIGSPLHRVAEALKEKLLGEFSYEACDVIRLSKSIEKHGAVQSTTSRHDRIKALIEAGNELRRKFGPSVLAELAISDIALARVEAKERAGSERFLPRRVCHIIDSVKNQEELDILRLVYRDMLYFVGVFSPLSSKVKAMQTDGMSQAEVYELIDKDSGEEVAHGQTVRDTFPQADFFIRIDAATNTQISAKVERFLHLVLGTKMLTPTAPESAMYAAASAAGNSACLSRQVGASVIDSAGEILAVGWNDVPKFGGGPYIADQKSDPNSDRDKRCWNMESGICFNDREKRVIAELLIDVLVKDKVIGADVAAKAVDLVIGNSKVKDLIEFSRSIHAEVHAILAASQLNGDRIKGASLYCTTYPCHSCARHIIAAGIKEVFYIEPYRKSLATKLHYDAITEDDSDQNRVRILPYDGVAPTRFLKFFRVPQDSRKKNGKMIKVDPKKASPRFDKTLQALPELEALVVKELRDRQVI